MVRKGQAQAVVPIAAIILIAVFIPVTALIYGYVADATPHDKTYTNESICTTCVNGSNGGTTYLFDHVPVINDTTLVCSNNTGATAMVNGVASGTCLGYNVLNDGTVNITNTSGPNGCEISNMRCTYTHNWASDDQENFWDSTTDTTWSGFALISVLVIVIASVVIIGFVMLFKGV